MQREEIEGIIAKYQKLANSSSDDDGMFQRFVDFIEENAEVFAGDEYYETEKELMEYFNEVEAEVDAQWEAMYPKGDAD